MRKHHAVRLNRLGRLTMNNPARERLLLGYVGSKLEALDPSPAGRTLIVGCGQGADIALALNRFNATHVVAIDIDPHQVARAQTRLGGRDRITIAVGDALAIDWIDGSFDTVFDLGAVHLIPEWRQAYAEIARVLRPGGKLRFETIVGRSFRATMRLSTHGFTTPATGYTYESVVTSLRDCRLSCPPQATYRPRAAVLTGLVGDLIGVATKTCARATVKADLVCGVPSTSPR